MAITEDVSQPPPVFNSGASGAAVPTVAFSPPQALLLAEVTVAYQGATAPSVTLSDSGVHTWTQTVVKNNSGAWAAHYITYLSTAPGKITVTAADAAAHACTIGLEVKVLDNANPTQTGAATANTGATSNQPWGTVTPTTQFSRVWVSACSQAMQQKVNALSSATLTEDTYLDSANQSTGMKGRWVSQSGTSFSALQLGWTTQLAADWAWVATEVLSADVSKSSSDTGAGSDAVAKVQARVFDTESATGNEIRNQGAGTGTNLLLSAPADTGAGNDTSPAANISKKWTNVGSADSGTGTEGGHGPVTLAVGPSADFGTGTETSSVPFTFTPIIALVGALAQEGFSLNRCAVMEGTGGAESAQLYGAQTITITPDISSSDLQADDEEFGTWYMLNKATVQVVNGYMSFSTIAALNGIPVASSGLSPHDYYGLPLWTQYQHNQPSVSLAFDMASRNTFGVGPRTLTFVLYAVQLSVLDFTGTVYKTGLQVSYAGTVLFSSFDEAGHALAGPEVGRIVSSAGQQAGVLGRQPFQGV